VVGATSTETARAAGGGFGPPPGGYAPQPGGFGGPPPGAPGGFGGQAPGGPYPNQYANPYYPAPPPPVSGPTSQSIVALVMGLLSMMTTCFPLGLVALWLGARARKAARLRGEPNGSPDDMMALIGMIIGGIFGGLWGLYWLFNLAMIVLGFGAAFLPIIFG
jgi:hypothetical protein